jgi:hypothetical protein
MGMSAGEITDLREIVAQDLRSADEGAKAAFLAEFGKERDSFTDHTVSALATWTDFRDTIDDDDQRRLPVAAIAFTAINHHISSYKLFMSGYTVASGSLFRQVLEGVSLASLCSVGSLSVLDRYIAGKYSTKNAVRDLGKFATKVRVNSKSVGVIAAQYEFYHAYAHLTQVSIAVGTNFSLGGAANIGAYFDPEKIREYRKEIHSRIGFAKVLPNFVKGVAANVASW